MGPVDDYEVGHHRGQKMDVDAHRGERPPTDQPPPSDLFLGSVQVGTLVPQQTTANSD